MAPPLLARESSVLVVVDVQEKLLPAIEGREALLARLDLLLHAARTLGIPVLATEQYPRGLGPTVAAVREAIPAFDPVSKIEFSCAAAPGFAGRLRETGRRQVVIAGIEAHVCVAQTAAELAVQGAAVFVVADATGSRRRADAETALRRLERGGVILTTAEAVVFEWLRRAGTPEFKAIQAKVKALA